MVWFTDILPYSDFFSFLKMVLVSLIYLNTNISLNVARGSLTRIPANPRSRCSISLFDGFEVFLLLVSQLPPACLISFSGHFVRLP